MNRGSRGLSYLEMLVSLALFSIMTALIAGTLDFGRRAWERTDDLAQIGTDAILRADLREWLEWASYLNRPDLPRRFEGRTDGFSYAGGLARDGFDGLDKLSAEVTIRPDDTGRALHWQRAAWGADDRLENAGTFASGLSDIRFTYYGRRDFGGPVAWHDTWPPEAGLPQLIRITASRDRPWPPLTVAPAKALAQRRISASSPLPPG